MGQKNSKKKPPYQHKDQDEIRLKHKRKSIKQKSNHFRKWLEEDDGFDLDDHQEEWSSD